ncbi:MAG: ABC transporter substrate binding protein [Rhodocyclaceae bacterium]|nr:ABC transporter substrate binding protein [Rhodocyclaceae bacterium]
MLERAILIVSLLMTAIAAMAADSHVLILREEGPIARQTAEFLMADLARQGAVGRSIRQFEIGDQESASVVMRGLRVGEDAVVVAIGPRALRPALQVAGGRPVLAILVSLAVLEDFGPGADRIRAIVLDQPMPRLLNLVQAALPSARRLGVLAGPASMVSLRILVRHAQDRGLTVAADVMTTSGEVVAALERLVPRMELLLALPDPLVHNRNTVQPLLLTTYRADIPVVTYSESYLHAGAAVALFSTPKQVALQAAEAILQYPEKGLPLPIQTPRYFTVGVNTAVVRSLGLSLPTAAELQERLGSLE